VVSLLDICFTDHKLAINPGTISDPNHARLHGSTIRIFGESALCFDVLMTSDLAGDEDAQKDVIGDNNNSSRVQESVRITQSYVGSVLSPDIDADL